jgi:hypothetical protein
MNFWYECLLFIRFELVDFDWALTSLKASWVCCFSRVFMPSCRLMLSLNVGRLYFLCIYVWQLLESQAELHMDGEIRCDIGFSHVTFDPCVS